MLTFTDIALTVSAALLSALVVLRYGALGWPVGVFLVWALGGGELAWSGRHAQPRAEHDLVMGIWLGLAGWIIGVAWCTAWLVLGRLYRWADGPRAEKEPNPALQRTPAAGDVLPTSDTHPPQ